VAVELIVVTPIIVVILFGIIQFGTIWSQLENYLSAAREGARFAAVRCLPDSSTGCTNTLIKNRVNASTAFPVSGNPAENFQCSSSTIGQLVTVSWSQNLSYNIPFFGAHTYTKTIRAGFRCE